MSPDKLVQCIPYGKTNAKPTSELVSITGHESVREFRRDIQIARKAGYPICGCKNGMFIASDRQEIMRQIAFMRCRSLSELKTANILENLLLGMEGQIELDF